jgi:hypothetical protein
MSAPSVWHMQGHPWRNINIALRFQKQISQKIANKYTANLALGEKIKIQFQTGARIYTGSGSVSDKYTNTTRWWCTLYTIPCFTAARFSTSIYVNSVLSKGSRRFAAGSFLHGDAVADVAPHLSSSIFYSDQFIKVLRAITFFIFLFFFLFSL